MASLIPRIGPLFRITQTQRLRPLVNRTIYDFPASVAANQYGKEKEIKRKNDWKNVNIRMHIQAKKSVLISTTHDKLPHVREYCAKFGTIKKAIPFITSQEYVLVQFETMEAASDILNSCLNYMKEANLGNYTQSRFLEFSDEGNLNTHSEKTVESDWTESDVIPQFIGKSVGLHVQKVRNCSSLSEQILLLYECMTWSSLELQLGYLVAESLESSLNGLFPELNCVVLGSQTSGCLEIFCCTGGMEWGIKKNKNETYISYFRKLDTDKKVSRFIAALLSTTLAEFDMNRNNVKLSKVRNSTDQIYETNVLSLPFKIYVDHDNLDMILMTIIINALGRLFDGLKPLLFVINQWAKAFYVRKLSSFHFYMLTLFFLQQKPMCVLSPFRFLDDFYVHMNTSLLFNNLEKISGKCYTSSFSNEKDLLGKLFVGFVNYYAQFDFDCYAVSLAKGHPITKEFKDSDSLCLFPNRTFVHSVMPQDLNYFQDACKLTKSKLQSKSPLCLTKLLDP